MHVMDGRGNRPASNSVELTNMTSDAVLTARESLSGTYSKASAAYRACTLILPTLTLSRQVHRIAFLMIYVLSLTTPKVEQGGMPFPVKTET